MIGDAQAQKEDFIVTLHSLNFETSLLHARRLRFDVCWRGNSAEIASRGAFVIVTKAVTIMTVPKTLLEKPR